MHSPSICLANSLKMHYYHLILSRVSFQETRRSAMTGIENFELENDQTGKI